MAATPARPACASATLGPGATNFVTSAAYGQLGGMPVLMITGQKPIKKSKQGRFQIVDIVKLMGPVTKYAIQIAAGGQHPQPRARSLSPCRGGKARRHPDRTARGYRRGTVHRFQAAAQEHRAPPECGAQGGARGGKRRSRKPRARSSSSARAPTARRQAGCSNNWSRRPASPS